MIVAINPLPHLTPKNASCALIQGEDGMILGVSRKDNKNVFGIVGGKLDAGETFINAAIRETFEETGITITSLEYIFEDYCGDHSRDDVIYYCVAFKVTGWTDEPYTKEEGIVSWVTPEKLMEGCFGEYNKKLFKAAGIIT